MDEVTLVSNPVLTWALIFGMLALAGVVKGTIGFGFPLLAVSLLTTVMDINDALAIVPIPTLAANIWLVVQGGRLRWGLSRFWPVIVSLGPGVWFGSALLARINEQTLFLVIGMIVVIFSLIKQFALRLQVSAALEGPVGILAGLTGGLLGGLSTVFGPPITIYLVSINLQKEEFISAICLIFTCASTMLVIAFSAHSILNSSNIYFSISGIAPAAAGMLAGQWIRERLEREAFSRVVLVGLLIIGANLIRKGLM